jgi:hypothetical protein
VACHSPRRTAGDARFHRRRLVRDINWLALITTVLGVGAIVIALVFRRWDMLALVIALDGIAIAILAHADVTSRNT